MVLQINEASSQPLLYLSQYALDLIPWEGGNVLHFR
jgi:hypothetical protein